MWGLAVRPEAVGRNRRVCHLISITSIIAAAPSHAVHKKGKDEGWRHLRLVIQHMGLMSLDWVVGTLSVLPIARYGDKSHSFHNICDFFASSKLLDHVGQRLAKAGG